MKIGKTNILNLTYFVLFYCIKNGISISHLKLQKLLYYIQAWHLVYFKKNNIFDELPEAWVNGPVYRTVYNEFKRRGMYDKFELTKDNLNVLDLKSTKINEILKSELNNEQFEFISQILTHYGCMSHDRLVYLTHKELPWNNARKSLGPFDYKDNYITVDDMYNYYSTLLKRSKSAK